MGARARARKDTRDTAEELAGRAHEATVELASAAAPLVESAVETVSGVLEDAGHRGGAAWTALRGQEPGPPARARRWPWALGAAAAGAAAGAAVAYVLGRVPTADSDDELDPAEVVAVVDRPQPAPPGA